MQAVRGLQGAWQWSGLLQGAWRVSPQPARLLSSVETRLKGGLATVTLNRPKALNALNLDMIRQLEPLLRGWEGAASGVAVVAVRGAGGKAFCAGGDIRAITAVPGGPEQREFFREEYRLDQLVGRLNIPYIAIMNGITMGGGVGISVNGRFRIATEKTVFAMPETAIGLVPDVGGGWFLPRLPGQLGMFLGLTGHRLKGWDCLKAGVATHAVKEENVETLLSDLVRLTETKENITEADVEAVLSEHTPEEALDHTFSLAEHGDTIDRTFNGETVEEIISRLEREPQSALVKRALAALAAASPTSLAVAHRQIRTGGQLASLAEVLQMEHRLVLRCCQDKDFYEGVRATLVDRDNSPAWQPASLQQVTQDRLDWYFSSLGTEELQFE